MPTHHERRVTKSGAQKGASLRAAASAAHEDFSRRLLLPQELPVEIPVGAGDLLQRHLDALVRGHERALRDDDEAEAEAALPGDVERARREDFRVEPEL